MSAHLRKNWLEWSVFGVGAVLIAATVGYLGVQAARPGENEPALTVTFGAPEPRAIGYAVPVEIRNTAAGAAEAVTVEAGLELRQGGLAAETARITVEYVPGYGRRTARLEFRSDPRQGTLVVRSVSYAMP
jgi:uncharacterized protein (TIGR02588 family)